MSEASGANSANGDSDPSSSRTAAEQVGYVLSLPERALRSGTGLLGGIVRESASLLVPQSFQSSRTYTVMVQQMLDFLVHDVGGVAQGETPSSTAEIDHYVARKAVGNFVDLASLATLHMSPLLLLAAVSDVAYGSQVYLKELAGDLKARGLIDEHSSIDHVNDLLTAVSEASAASGKAFNTPPLSVEALKQTINETRAAISSANPADVLPQAEIRRMWEEMREIARGEGVGMLAVSGAATMHAMAKFATLGRGALSSVKVAGTLLDRHVLEHYSQALKEIRQKGLYQSLAESSQPYTAAVWENFQPRKPSVTENVISGKLAGGAWRAVRKWWGHESPRAANSSADAPTLIAQSALPAQSTPATQRDLVDLSASEMARQIAAGKLTSVELVEAHIRRIEMVNPSLNALVVPLFAQARAEAAAADEAQRRGQPLGLLHGVPITVKECFHLAGTAATEGVDRFAGEVMASDAPLVRRLRRAGAIVLGKTNLPQLMLIHETDNPLFGRTNNPWNIGRSPGGSSGGEAAIIAAGGSPLGLANDLGGSIRQPAHSCGICGLKPTTLRLTNAGVRDNLHGMEAIRPQPGPLARTVEDLYLALRVLTALAPHEIDPQTAPVPLGDPSGVRVEQLRIGMWTDDGFFSASPALRRAVGEAADALRRLGAHVEPFQPPDIACAMGLYFSLMSADGTADAVRTLGHGRRDWRIQRMIRLGKSPGWLRAVMRASLNALGQRHTAELLGWIGRRSADRYWQLSAARTAYAQRFFEMWSGKNLDALICPPHALPALRHGSSEHLVTAASYCYWANLLGVPAGVVPATRVRAAEQGDRPSSRDVVQRAAQAVEADSAGLPVGVQVAARPWREDVVLAVMAALESHFRGQSDFPRTPLAPPPPSAVNPSGQAP